MEIISIYILLYLYIIIFDLMPIKRNKYKKIFWFNSITICISFLIVVLVGLNIKVISPSDLIQNIVSIFVD